MASCLEERTVASVSIRIVEELSGNVVPEEFVQRRSVVVTEFKSSTTSEQLIIHFQRKQNGGGDIERITRSFKRQAAVITFLMPEVVESVVQHKHKVDDVKLTVKRYSDDDIRAEVFDVVSAELYLEYVQSLSREAIEDLLAKIEAKIGLRWIESAESFLISGTLSQVKEAYKVLMKGMYLVNGIEVFSDKEIKNEETPQPQETGLSQANEERHEVMQKDVNQKSAEPPLAVASQASPWPERATDSHNDQGPPSESLALEVLPFEVLPRRLKVLAGAHKKELDDIETEYRVSVPRAVTEGNQISLKPCNGCSAEDYEKACDAFITLYQKTSEIFKAERFSLSGSSRKVSTRDAISRMSKEVPEVLIERSKDQKHWEMFGEEGHLQEALSYLKRMGVEIEMESKAFKDGSDQAGRAKPQGAERSLDGDQSENPRGSTTSSDELVLYYGRVKLSVYQGDITSEHTDVIVSPSDNQLNHSGGVAKAIFDKGGKEVEHTSRDVMRKKHGGFLKDGEAIWTKPGNLSCKYVVHVVAPVWNTLGPKKSREFLHRACLNSLLEAEKRKATSIALPAIGSGSHRMPKDVCAEVMCDTVLEFVEQRITQKKTITDIRFVNNDDHSVQVFSKKLKTLIEYDSLGDSSRGGSTASAPSRSVGDGFEGDLASSNHKTHQPGHSKASSHTIGNDASRLVTQHPLSPGSSGDVNDQSFSAPGRSSSHGTSYSTALKRNTPGDYASLQNPQQTGAPDERRDNKDQECPICLHSFSNPRSLKCKHTFCSNCLQQALGVSNKCPVCQEPQGVLKGNQPPGEMRSRVASYSVPGYEGYGTIEIDYSFLSGIQGVEHPNPGQRYEGTSRQAYLPDTREGREVLELLRRAFDARLVFTVGTSTTTGLQNQTTWNDIHHKTSRYGGPFRFGYPDPDYLRRVKEELAAKGIK